MNRQTDLGDAEGYWNQKGCSAGGKYQHAQIPGGGCSQGTLSKSLGLTVSYVTPPEPSIDFLRSSSRLFFLLALFFFLLGKTELLTSLKRHQQGLQQVF